MHPNSAGATTAGVLSFDLFQCKPDKSLNLCLARFSLYRLQYVCIGVSVEFEAHKDGVFPRPFFARVTLCHSINSLLRFPLDMVYNITSGRPAFAQAVAPNLKFMAWGSAALIR